MIGVQIENSYGDNYTVQAGATVIAGGAEKAMERKKQMEGKPAAKPKAGRKTETVLKPTRATFVLDAEEAVRNQRIQTLTRCLKAELVRRKSMIDKNTDVAKIIALFSGKPVKEPLGIRWTGGKQCLSYIFRKLTDYGYVTIPPGETIWMMARSHIVDGSGKQFGDDLHDQHDPQGKTLRVLNMMVEVLNMSKSEAQVIRELSAIISA